MRLTTVFLVILVSLVLVDLSTARGRGEGSKGGSRGGSKGSRTRTSRTRSGSSSQTKITKYTPITPTSARSPVIRSQTKLGSRSSTVKRVVASYLVYSYLFRTAPVYRRGYPMYRSYVSIPEERAVRVTFEEEQLLNDYGVRCLGQLKQNVTLEEGIDDNLVELNTTVKYENGKIMKLYGVNNTVSLEDIKDEGFEVISRARYNTTIVKFTTCTQVEKTVRGTMVTMYETNPNTASQVDNNKLFTSFIALFAFITVSY